MVSEGPGTRGTRIVDTNYPFAEGLIAGTTKQVGERHLIPEEKSLVPSRYKAGID